MQLHLDVSAGELVDRITILELKLERLPEEHRSELLVSLEQARRVLARGVLSSPRLNELTQNLRAINAQLWDAEEELRYCEQRQEFGEYFVHLARTVYLVNDRRAALKAKIDSYCGLGLRELKSYALPE